MPLTNVFSAATLICYNRYCRYRYYSPLPGLPLVLPLIGVTGLSVFVLIVGQGTQVAQAAVVHTAIVDAIASYLNWPRGLP